MFEWKGTEYVAFYAGGSALGATPHGDDVWLFSLHGGVGPEKSAGKAGGVLHTGEKPNAAAGSRVFAANCSVCHGNLGQGGNGGPNLQTRPDTGTLARVLERGRDGGGEMPSFKDRLSSRQIQDVAAYVTERIAKPPKSGAAGQPG